MEKITNKVVKKKTILENRGVNLSNFAYSSGILA